MKLELEGSPELLKKYLEAIAGIGDEQETEEGEEESAPESEAKSPLTHIMLSF